MSAAVVTEAFQAAVDASEKIDGSVSSASKLVLDALKEHEALIQRAAALPAKPEDKGAFLAPLADKMGVIGDLPTSGKFGQFIDAIQSFTNLLAWVSLDKLPVAYLKENKEIMDFTLTKLMQQSADNRPWSQALMKTATALITFVEGNHKVGLTFGGVTASSGSETATSAVPATASAAVVTEAFQAAVDASEKIDGSVSSASKLVLDALKEHEALIQRAAALPAKPEDKGAFLAPLADKMGVIGDLPTSGKFGQFIDAIQSFTNLLAWVSLDKLPVAYLKENKEIMDFTLTKLMQQSADNRPWSQALMKTATALITFVEGNHKVGLTFGGAVGPNSQRGGASAPAPQAPKIVGGKKIGGPKAPPGPPPPPPPPSGGAAASTSSAATDGRSQLFSQIGSMGLDITKGLKHVTDDQKLYKQKNRELRTVNEDDIRKKKLARKGIKQWAPPKGVKSIRCPDDKRWIVEYCGDGDSLDREHITLEDSIKMNHAIFINRCNNCYINIVGKVNSIQIVECLNVQVQFSETVGPIEITNSERMEVLVTKHCPQLMSSKVKELTLHLAGSVETDIVTSCTSNMNVTYQVVDAEGDKDSIEVAVPEQFMHKLAKRNKITTTLVSHGE